MADRNLFARAIHGVNVAAMTGEDRLAVRASDGVDELLELRAMLRTKAAGRGRWLLWTWLLVLGGATVSVEGPNSSAAFVVFPVMVLVLVLVVSYVVRTRNRANYADQWLSEVDFRLAQLAAQGTEPAVGP